jgi:hypothetical protein
MRLPLTTSGVAAFHIRVIDKRTHHSANRLRIECSIPYTNACRFTALRIAVDDVRFHRSRVSHFTVGTEWQCQAAAIEQSVRLPHNIIISTLFHHTTVDRHNDH